jgi:acyl-CoA thioesterase
LADTEFDELEEEHEEHHSIVLETHKKISDRFSGYIHSIDQGYAEVYLEIVDEMIADEMGLIHSGFLFSAASFASVAAINNPNAIVIGAQVHFFTPVRVDTTVIFEAHSRHKVGKRRVVEVTGRLGDIKVFSGSFSVAVMESHILNIKLEEVKVEKKRESSEEGEKEDNSE